MLSADPEDGYGWEKLFSERMCRHFSEDFGLETRVLDTIIFMDQLVLLMEEEKSTCGFCKKIILAKK